MAGRAGSARKHSRPARMPESTLELGERMRDDLNGKGVDVSMVDVFEGVGELMKGNWVQLEDEIRLMFEADPDVAGWKKIPNGDRHKKRSQPRL